MREKENFIITVERFEEIQKYDGDSEDYINDGDDDDDH